MLTNYFSEPIMLISMRPFRKNMLCRMDKKNNRVQVIWVVCTYTMIWKTKPSITIESNVCVFICLVWCLCVLVHNLLWVDCPCFHQRILEDFSVLDVWYLCDVLIIKYYALGVFMCSWYIHVHFICDHHKMLRHTYAINSQPASTNFTEAAPITQKFQPVLNLYTFM